MKTQQLESHYCWGAWMAQLKERMTLDLGIVSWSPMLSADMT